MSCGLTRVCNGPGNITGNAAGTPTASAGPDSGRPACAAANLGSFAYQPNANFVGQDSFTLQTIWNVNKSHTIRYDIQVVP